jgi:hypothetical protein
VYGAAPNGTGVLGESDNRTGVLGTRGPVVADPNEPTLEAGVYGVSAEDVPGVAAKHTAGHGGVALKASGRVQLSSAGRDAIPVGTYQKTVNHPAVFANSVVIVTLNSNPGNGALKYVNVVAGAFTVILNPPSLSGVQFSYLILNGSAPIL